MNWRRRDGRSRPHSPSTTEVPAAPPPTEDAVAAELPADRVPTADEAAVSDIGSAPPVSAERRPLEDVMSHPGREGEVVQPRPLPTRDLGPVATSGHQERDTSQAVIFAVTNQKGGVGKTTTTVSLGAALADEGLDVLIVDLDPQGNATTGLGLRVTQGSPSTYRVIVEQYPMVDAAEPTAVRRLHIVPSSLDLAGAEIELVPQFSRELRLRSALDTVRDQYDVVLIDCPPSLGLLTVNALVAADRVLVPIQCEYYALEGLGQLMRTVEMVRANLNERLALGGVLMTMFDARTNLSQQVVDEIRAHFGELAFSTVIPRTVRLSEAPSYGQPITEFDPSSRGARAYQRLAREVAQRLGFAPTPTAVSPLDALLGTVGPADPPSTTSPDAPEQGAEAVSGSRTGSEPAATSPTVTGDPDTSEQRNGLFSEHGADSAALDDAPFHVEHSPPTDHPEEDAAWQR